MATIKLRPHEQTKLAALALLANDLPQYCALPIDGGRPCFFHFHPSVFWAVVECLEGEINALAYINKINGSANLQLNAQHDLSGMLWDFEDDLEEFYLNFNHADNTSTVCFKIDGLLLGPISADENMVFKYIIGADEMIDLMRLDINDKPDSITNLEWAEYCFLEEPYFYQGKLIYKALSIILPK